MLLKRIGEEIDVFEKDAFTEIERYASKEPEKNDVFEIIFLRRKLLAQLFNYVSLLFKSKRLIKRIFDSQKKIESQEAKKNTSIIKKSKKGSSNNINDTSSSNKNFEPSEASSEFQLRAMSITDCKEKHSNEIPLVKKSFSTRDEEFGKRKDYSFNLKSNHRKGSIGNTKEESKNPLDNTRKNSHISHHSEADKEEEFDTPLVSEAEIDDLNTQKNTEGPAIFIYDTKDQIQSQSLADNEEDVHT